MARAPISRQEQIKNIFRSPENIQYLHGLFEEKIALKPFRLAAQKGLTMAVYNFKQVDDLISSDPWARRGAARAAINLWSEVRRINLEFFNYRLKMLQDMGHLISHTLDDDDEPYHMRMFIADSLRPPGYEHLNATGPLYEILENTQIPMFDKKKHITITSPAMAINEYWKGSNAALDGAPSEGYTYNNIYGEGPQWRQEGGGRFMRYPVPPTWQNLTRSRPYERDIEETLEPNVELDSPIRRWDRERLLKPRGEEYRRYGARD